jgi:hypothetical protein
MVKRSLVAKSAPMILKLISNSAFSDFQTLVQRNGNQAGLVSELK